VGNNLSPFYRAQLIHFTGGPLFEFTKTFLKIRKFGKYKNKKIQENTKNKKFLKFGKNT